MSSSAARRTYSVLSWPAAEVAEALNTTPAAVNSALLRARTQIAKVAPIVDNIVETCRAAPARAARPLRRSLHQRCCMGAHLRRSRPGRRRASDDVPAPHRPARVGEHRQQPIRENLARLRIPAHRRRLRRLFDQPGQHFPRDRQPVGLPPTLLDQSSDPRGLLLQPDHLGLTCRLPLRQKPHDLITIQPTHPTKTGHPPIPRARPEITFTKSCCVVECMYVRFGCGVCARREVRAVVAAS